MRRFFARLRNLLNSGRAERDLSREIASHLDLLQEAYERRGLSPEEARLAARRAYGGVEQARELHRDARSFLWVEHRIRDMRYGARNLARTPGFTAVALLTLALGIGATTAIFSVVNAVLLRPLPYRDAGKLVTLLHGGTGPVASGNYLDWRDQNRSFDAMGAADAWGPNLTGIDHPEHLAALQVTQNLLPMLGIQPALGRLFRPGEDQPGNEHEVILSDRLWRRRFSADPAVLGRTILLDGAAYTIIGVMPREFRFPPFWATRAELWAPDVLADRAQNRGGNSMRVFARLKDGVTLAEARAEMAGITARLERQYPGTNRDVRVTPLKENVVGNIRSPLLILLASVAFVLLIACANVAHMLLARTSDREREIAVRTALGAAKSRVIGQFLTENLLLAGLGAVTGLALAAWGIKALVKLAPGELPRIQTVSIDLPVLVFLLIVTLLTTLLFGLAPAMRAAAAEVNGALKDGGRSGSEGVRRNRVRAFLVASEFALAFMLLIGAGLMIRSFIALKAVDPGFNPHGVLSMVVSVAGSAEAQPGRRVMFYRQLLDRVRALPGVEAAGGINHLPVAGDLWGWPFIIEGRPKPRPGESPGAVYRIVMPGYFQTMRLPLRRGREITDADDSRTPGVVLINERAAATYWPGEDPLGKRISFENDKEKRPIWLTIIGVVKDARQYDWAARPDPEVYLAALQHHDFLEDPAAHWSYLTLVLRTRGNPADLAAAVKRTVWSFDKNLPISEVLTMDAVVAGATAEARFEMLLLAVFAAVALLLAVVGIYGVMNYAVSRRTHEIGIRISLGASRAEVLRLVARQGMIQALAGLALGAIGALLLARLIAGILYGVRPTDPATFIVVMLVLVLAAVTAVCVPAHKASRVEPMIALRHE
ncbi:MAG TPA: ABC transporter permease [Bryobacteraceae bacterium]|nr:ABC transporter permease [Bryobacteraceae bacterium]